MTKLTLIPAGFIILFVLSGACSSPVKNLDANDCADPDSVNCFLYCQQNPDSSTCTDPCNKQSFTAVMCSQYCEKQTADNQTCNQGCLQDSNSDACGIYCDAILPSYPDHPVCRPKCNKNPLEIGCPNFCKTHSCVPQ